MPIESPQVAVLPTLHQSLALRVRAAISGRYFDFVAGHVTIMDIFEQIGQDRAMSMTAASCKSKFDNAQNQANSKNTTATAWGGGPDKAGCWAQIAATWAFLYVEKSRIEKEKLVPSALAEGYAVQAEQRLTSAESKTGNEIPTAMAFATMGSNAAYVFAELVRVENMVVG